MLVRGTGVESPRGFQLADIGRIDLIDVLISHVALIISVVWPVKSLGKQRLDSKCSRPTR
jgi:hypothetical protein